jgi:hypothetical protein
VGFISIVGDGLVWKNAHKFDMLNRTSETMSRIIPHHRPFVTIFVYVPSYVPSRVMSRLH